MKLLNKLSDGNLENTKGHELSQKQHAAERFDRIIWLQGNKISFCAEWRFLHMDIN